MESASSIRITNPMVAAGDRTDILGEYGIRIFEPSVVAKAKAIVEHFVADADARFTAHVRERQQVPQSPYDDLVIDGQEMRQVAVVQLGTLGDFEAELLARLGPKHGHFVDGDQLSRKVAQVFTKLLEDHGFEVVACKAAEYGGGLTRVIVRDPSAHRGHRSRGSPRAARESDRHRGRHRCAYAVLASSARCVAPCHRFGLSRSDARRCYLPRGRDFGRRVAVTESTISHYSWDCAIADPRRVTEHSSSNYFAGGLRVPLAAPQHLLDRAKSAVGKAVSLDEVQVVRCFMQNLANRVASRPELLVAAVAGTFASNTLVAVCSPEPPPPPPPKLTFNDRVAQYFVRLERGIRAALPGPSAKALPTPAPEPIVVPAIKFEPRAKG